MAYLSKKKVSFCIDRYKSYVNKVELIEILKVNATNPNPIKNPKLETLTINPKTLTLNPNQYFMNPIVYFRSVLSVL